MANGGISTSQSAEQILRWITLLTPGFISVYLLLGGHHIFGLSFTRPVSTVLTDTFAGVWIVSGIFMAAVYNNTNWNRVLRMSFFHLLGSGFILMYLGMSFPLVVLWIILILANYTYFGIQGVVISIELLGITTMFDVVLHPETTTADIAMASSITILSVALVGFLRIQERDEVEFESTRKAERLERDSNLTLINNLTDAVVSTDTDGKIKIYNPAMLGLVDTNISIGEQSIDAVLKLESSDGSPIKLTELLSEAKVATVNDDLRLPVGDTDFLRLEITYTPIRKNYSSGSKSLDDGYVVIIRDITKTKSLEEERDEFISVVSHELRTPITITEGAIDNARLIFAKDATKVDAVKNSLDMAHEQTVFLARMVNDLSTLSRAERGVADAPEIIDVLELAHSLHAEYAPQAEKKQLRFNLSAHGKLGHVKASRLYLQELLQNFITNAIKYTKEGHVNLTITRHGDTVEFDVSDSGIGISKSDQAKIFQKFYRAEDYRTRETSGTGLGLYVATKLAKKLGTIITVKSRLNHGSSFGFTLPVEEITHLEKDSDDSASQPSPSVPSK